jgi:hypothetical protein
VKSYVGEQYFLSAADALETLMQQYEVWIHFRHNGLFFVDCVMIGVDGIEWTGEVVHMTAVEGTSHPVSKIKSG